MDSQIFRFTEKMESLLQLEREAELEESANIISRFSLKELEKRNLAITKLFIKDISTGIYGKILLCLNRPHKILQKERSEDRESKLTKFSPGDIVGLFQSDKQQATDGQDRLEGIVYKVNEEEIVISFKEMHDFDGLKQPVSLIILANEVTHKRCKEALESLKAFSSAKNQRLIEVLFEQEPPKIDDGSEYIKDLKYFNDGLNLSQREAIEKCLASRDVSLIHGPPGTGKTTTVVELILQGVEIHKTKVMACAPSNIAVDNMIERMHTSNPKLKIVRIGHPARLLESVQKFCLDALLQQHGDYGKQTQDIKKQMNRLNQKVQKSKSKTDRKEIWGEYKMLKKDLRSIESQIINEIFSNANVICCTLTSACDKTLVRYIKSKLQDNLFDLLVIDECAQSIEPACWIPLRFAKKIVMAGDHKQLDATVKSDEASKKGLSLSLFERVMNFKTKVSTMLNEQYRMNEKIMNWSSNAMYEGGLIAHENVKHRVIGDLYDKSTDELMNDPLLLIDTAGSLMYEGVDEQSENESKYNNGECDLVVSILKELLSIGVKKEAIGVITPYSAQVNLIKKHIRHSQELQTLPDPTTNKLSNQRIEVSTVDGFQGREKEVIIISMVRSNLKGEIGFLSNERRMNVAVTRAKRLCVLIGDSGTVGKNKFLKGLVEYFKANGLNRSAFDYQGNPEVRIMYGVTTGSSGVTKQELMQKGEEKVSSKLSQAEKKKAKKENQKLKKQQDLSKQDSQNTQEEQKIGFHRAKHTAVVKNEEERKESDIIREADLRKTVDQFMEDQSKQSLEFPKSLNSWERQVIHTYCEEIHISHESKGEGNQRFILVSKPPQSQEFKASVTEVPSQQLPQQQPQQPQTLTNQPIVDEEKLSEDPTSTAQNKQMQDYIQRRKQLDQQKEQSKAIAKEKKPKEPKQKKQKNKVDTMSAKNDMDDLEFLDSLIKENKQCALGNCQISIELMYCICKYCKKRFCPDHFYPERHQCEEESKVESQKPINSGNQKALRSKAQQAIKEMEAKRLAKPSKKEQNNKK